MAGTGGSHCWEGEGGHTISLMPQFFPGWAVPAALVIRGDFFCVSHEATPEEQLEALAGLAQSHVGSCECALVCPCYASTPQAALTPRVLKKAIHDAYCHEQSPSRVGY